MNDEWMNEWATASQKSMHFAKKQLILTRCCSSQSPSACSHLAVAATDASRYLDARHCNVRTTSQEAVRLVRSGACTVSCPPWYRYVTEVSATAHVSTPDCMIIQIMRHFVVGRSVDWRGLLFAVGLSAHRCKDANKWEQQQQKNKRY
jgi:hypothetical protein